MEMGTLLGYFCHPESMQKRLCHLFPFRNCIGCRNVKLRVFLSIDARKGIWQIKLGTSIPY